MEEERRTTTSSSRRTVCLIGDIHGHLSKLESLWSNLEARVGEPSFRTALVVFLGDYCDRGPDTRGVLDFLLSLPSRYPHQSQVFLCGNHDLAFAAFVGALSPPPQGFPATWQEYAPNEEREGWFRGEGYEAMHLQGRRWGGNIRDRWNPKKGMAYKGSIYDAAPTFLSYGVPHGSADLSKAVPEEHRRFLSSLVWVHEEDDVSIDTPGGGRLCCKMLAVHAGLEKSKNVEEQLRRLRAKDTSIPKVEALSGRANVWEIPKELSGSPTIIASGHHAAVHIDGLRIILDENGGFENKPIAALVLPSMDMVRSNDDVSGKPQ